MSPTTPSDLGIVLLFLRRGQGWKQARLAEAAGLPVPLLNDYEAGRKPLTRPRLEHLISFMGLPPDTIDHTLARLDANRAAGRPTQEGLLADHRRRIEAVAVQTGALATDLARTVLSNLGLEGERLQASLHADFLWTQLKKKDRDDRIALVVEGTRFHTWGLCERVAAESIEAAPSSPSEALALAELALRIAEHCPGSQAWRWRLEGYAWFHVCNARRVNNDLHGADAALAKAKKLWEAGAPGDPGLLAEAIVLALEADLRKIQRRFSEALRRIDDALSVDRGDYQGKLLLTKAQILQALGDTEASTEVLRKAIPYIDEDREPRTALGVCFQLLSNLCLEDRPSEAIPGLPAVRALAERLGQERDLVRVVWLQGKVAAGLHQVEEAEAAFEQVRRHFASTNLALDYAFASLDLALLWLTQNRTAEVRGLADQMAWIFKTQGVHQEALAALQIFCDAARNEAASLEFARAVVRFLHRSRYDPKLRFEAGGAEALP